ncbi:MAG: PPC domain-containing protein [Deltaproteobacteria bacterium]|nr:PPC domain-containing protein [Deltaproteobacteria bacterium]
MVTSSRLRVRRPLRRHALPHLARRLALATLLSMLANCGANDAAPKCTTTDGCPDGMVCDPSSGLCTRDACVTDPDCARDDARKRCDPATRTCIFRDGFADDCDSARPCDLGKFCSVLLGRCLDTASAVDCIRRSQCPSGQICDHSANKCVETMTGCLSDLYCEPGEMCDTVNARCEVVVDECTACTASIVPDRCPTATHCDEATLACVPDSDTQSGPCRSGERCVSGRCVQCVGDPECGPGLFCNTSTGRCESTAQCADTLDDCPLSSRIDCFVCSSQEVCDARTKTCQAPARTCGSEVDCDAGQLCDLTVSPSICVDRAPDCLNDTLDIPANNSVASARALTSANANSTTTETTAHGATSTAWAFDDLSLCPGDVDWYALDIAPGTYLTVDARFEQADGDIDLVLLLPDGRTVIDASRSTTDNERVEIEVGTSRSLLVKVFLAVPTPQPVPYRLIVRQAPGNACADDPREPDDQPSEAREIVSDTPYEGRICSADPDWFIARDVPPGTRIRAQLAFTHSLGDLDLELRRADATAPIIAARSEDDDEEITYDASYGGDFLFRVVGKRADQNVYTLRVDLRQSADAVCRDDVFEPNDMFDPQTLVVPLQEDDATGTSTAPPQHFTQWSDLSVCKGDEDWYAIELMIDELFTAEIEFDPPADLALSLYPGTEPQTEDDPRLVPLAIANGFDPREWLVYRSPTAASTNVPVLLRVFGHGEGDLSPYTLRTTRWRAGTCTPDRFDRRALGDDIEHAIALGSPETSSSSSSSPETSRLLDRLDDLTSCTPDDEDWYELSLSPGQEHVLRLQWSNEAATLEASFFDADEAPREVASTRPTRNVQRTRFNQAAESEFSRVFVKISNAGEVGSRYNLVLDHRLAWPCQDDPFEPNNDRASATVRATAGVPSSSTGTATMTLRDLTLCVTDARSVPSNDDDTGDVDDAGDEDWFVIQPPAVGAELRATVRHVSGDLQLELRSPGGTRRACVNGNSGRCYSDGPDLEEAITFTATTTDPYFLRVGSVYSDPNLRPLAPEDASTPYTLEIGFIVP